MLKVVSGSMFTQSLIFFVLFSVVEEEKNLICTHEQRKISHRIMEKQRSEKNYFDDDGKVFFAEILK